MVTKHSQILSIFMNGIEIGNLEKRARGVLSFSYDKKWIETPGARPISLSLPLIDTVYTGDKVYNFFDNLLPDNDLVRAKIQARFHAPTDQPFDLLSHIGKDCVGAIQIGEASILTFEHKINAKPINENQIAAILRDFRKFPLGMSDLNKEFRISIAGAQEKTAFLFHKNKWNIPLGETPSSHIFKLPIGNIKHQNIDLSDSCENEWLCSVIAKAFGLNAANCEILYFEEMKVLVVERFDRHLSSDKSWIMRLPQEDMCQALGISSNLKYQSDGGPGIREIMHLLLGSDDPLSNRENFFRSQVLFWLLAAIDGHAKNFSIFIESEGKYRLTPLYDIISAFPLIQRKQLQIQKIKMAMALRGTSNHYHWQNIHPRHFLNAAKNAGFSVERAQSILDEMLDKVEGVIEQVSNEIPSTFPSNISEPIFKGMQQMKNKLIKEIVS